MICCKQTDRHRSRPAKWGRRHVVTASRASARYWQSIHVLFALKTQFSLCHLAAPLCGWSSGAQRPFAIVKDDIFFAWQVWPGDRSFGWSGEIEKLSRQFVPPFFFSTTLTFEIDFTYCDFAWVAAVILECLKRCDSCLSTCSIMAAIATCNNVNRILFFLTRIYWHYLCHLNISFSMWSGKNNKPNQQKSTLYFVFFLTKIVEFCNHNSSSMEPNFLVELTYKHSVLSCCPCWLKGKHAAIPSVSLLSVPCKNHVLAKTK